MKDSMRIYATKHFILNGAMADYFRNTDNLSLTKYVENPDKHTTE